MIDTILILIPHLLMLILINLDIAMQDKHLKYFKNELMLMFY